MSVKDLMLWAEEARRKMLARKAQAFDAALLPHQKPEVIRETVDQLATQLTEIEHGLPMEDIEAENERLIAERQAQAAKVLASRKKRGVHRPKRKVPKSARRIG